MGGKNIPSFILEIDQQVQDSNVSSISCPKDGRQADSNVFNWTFTHLNQSWLSLWSFFVILSFKLPMEISNFGMHVFFIYTQCTLLLVFSLIYKEASQSAYNTNLD